MDELEHQLLHNYEKAQKARDEYLKQMRDLQAEMERLQQAHLDARLKSAEYQGAMNVIAATLNTVKAQDKDIDGALVEAVEVDNADLSDAG